MEGIDLFHCHICFIDLFHLVFKFVDLFNFHDMIALVPVVVVTPTFNVPPLEHSRTGLGQTKRTGRPRR